MQLLSPDNFPDYELIDCGNFEKLERFGKFITIRPEPQAVWDKKLSEKEWEKTAHVKFVAKSSSSGMWKKLKEMPDRWVMEYLVGSTLSTVHSPQSTVDRRLSTVDNDQMRLKFRLALTSFKHVGIFPEQAVNWDYISESIQLMKVKQPKVLNLFAYTGGASLAAKAAGADITHLDSVKQVVTWSQVLC